MRALIDRYPQFLQNSPEFRDLQRALEPELLALWAARDGALEQLCVETADWGLPYWEKTLDIPVDGEKDPETRRGRVRVKLLGADVTTAELVRSAAEIWSGRPAELTEYPNEFRFEISFVGTNGIPPHMQDLTEAIRELIPAHLGWGYAFAYGADAPLPAGVGGFAEMGMVLEIGPRTAQTVEFSKTAAVGAVTEGHSRIEVYPAEQEAL